MTMARKMKSMMLVVVVVIGRGGRVVLGIAVSIRTCRCMPYGRITILLDFLDCASISICFSSPIKESAIDLRSSKVNKKRNPTAGEHHLLQQVNRSTKCKR